MKYEDKLAGFFIYIYFFSFGAFCSLSEIFGFFLPERNGKSIAFILIDFFISRFLRQRSRYQNRTSGGGVVINILTCRNVFECRHILNPKHAHNTDRISVKPPVLGPFVVKTLGKNLPQYWQDRLQGFQILWSFTIFDLSLRVKRNKARKEIKNYSFQKCYSEVSLRQ